MLAEKDPGQSCNKLLGPRNPSAKPQPQRRLRHSFSPSPTDPSTHGPTTPHTSGFIDPSILDPSTHQRIGPSTRQSIDSSIYRALNPWMHPLIHPSINPWIYHSTPLSIHPPVYSCMHPSTSMQPSIRLPFLSNFKFQEHSAYCLLPFFLQRPMN